MLLVISMLLMGVACGKLQQQQQTSPPTAEAAAEPSTKPTTGPTTESATEPVADPATDSMADQTPASMPRDNNDATPQGQDAPEGSGLAERKWKEGIRAYALGQEPFWSLDFDPDAGWTFQTPEGVLGRWPALPLRLDQQGHWVSEPSESASSSGGQWPADVRIVFVPEACTDGMAGTPYPFSVELRFTPSGENSPSVYRGCGRFPTNPALLGDWVLVERNESPIDARAFPRGMPNLHLDQSRDAVYGSDGCNRFNGRLRFSPAGMVVHPAVMSTRMACPGNAYTLAQDLAGRTWSVEYGMPDRDEALDPDQGQEQVKEGERLILQSTDEEERDAAALRLVFDRPKPGTQRSED
jgi:uncharacterized membrane protein